MGADRAKLSRADNANGLVDGDPDLRLSELHLLAGLVVFALSTNKSDISADAQPLHQLQMEEGQEYYHFLTVTAEMK